MDYEKEYKEALERAKIWQEHLYEVSDKDYADELNYIFPELRESEGEKIRKEILEYFQQFENEKLRGVNISDWIAWLEKQKSEGINVKALLTADKLASAEMTGRLKERKDIVENPQKYGLEKQGDKKSEWSKEDDNHLHSIYHYLRIFKDESDNDSVKKNIEEHINWLSKLYQIFLASQPKQEWSEEDESHLIHCISLINNAEGCSVSEYENAIAWLKSLKNRIKGE